MATNFNNLALENSMDRGAWESAESDKIEAT